MNLPVASVDDAVPFYTTIMGFEVVSHVSSAPGNSVTLGTARCSECRLAETGGDPSQDGCAFEVDGVENLLAEFKANGLEKESSDINMEKNERRCTWKVFYVVAPDGLCYWLGERQSA